MRFKSSYKGVHRRFALTPPTWENLEETLISLYGASADASVIVQYKDEDGDNIFISSDMELQEAIYIGGNKAALWITIEFDPAPENIPATCSSTSVSTPRSETPCLENPQFRAPAGFAAFDPLSQTPTKVGNAADAASQVSAVLLQFPPGPFAECISRIIPQLGFRAYNKPNSANAADASCSGTSAPAADGAPNMVAVHEGLECDSCGSVPITGIRYKCALCPDFDVCSDCEKRGVHNPKHPLLKITSPMDDLSVECCVEGQKWSWKRKRYVERPSSPKRHRT